MDLQDRLDLTSYSPQEISAAQFFARHQLAGQIITAENVAEALDTLDLIATLPENLHEQSVWAEVAPGHTLTGVQRAIDCGTACCFAGWHALRRGQTLHADPHYISGVYVDGDAQVSVEDFVCGDLNLPSYDGNGSHPFATHNTLADLRIWALAMFIRYNDLALAAGETSLFTVVAESEVHA